MKITAKEAFSAKFFALDEQDRQKILDFTAHVAQHGLKGLTGRNKSSAPQNPHTRRERAYHAYATKHCLWHYHIGIPEYVGDDGDMTSEYVLHYQRFDDEIVLVDIGTHPPFTLPTI